MSVFGDNTIMRPDSRPRIITVISLLSALQSVFRLYFFYLGVTGAELFDVEVATSTQQMINYTFLLIGIGGIITAFGLWQLKSWGYYGTILLSIGIIIFDAWGLTIQKTAALGLILPVIFLILLFRDRPQLIEMID